MHYEKVSSPFLLFKRYLDIIGRIIFNHCDKYLLLAIFEGNCGRYIIIRETFSEKKNSEKKRKVKEDVYVFAIKLIKRLVVSTCQPADSYTFTQFFNTYEPDVHYNNSYLSIDRQKRNKR